MKSNKIKGPVGDSDFPVPKPLIMSRFLLAVFYFSKAGCVNSFYRDIHRHQFLFHFSSFHNQIFFVSPPFVLCLLPLSANIELNVKFRLVFPLFVNILPPKWPPYLPPPPLFHNFCSVALDSPRVIIVHLFIFCSPPSPQVGR